jgi:hypothetical protein
MPFAARLCPVVVVLALSGGVAATAAPLPKSVFVARANGYCSAYYVKLNRLATPRTLPDLGRLLRAQRPYLVTLAAQLANLPPPVASRASYTAARLITMDNRYDALANSVGLRICGKPTSH